MQVTTQPSNSYLVYLTGRQILLQLVQHLQRLSSLGLSITVVLVFGYRATNIRTARLVRPARRPRKSAKHW